MNCLVLESKESFNLVEITFELDIDSSLSSKLLSLAHRRAVGGLFICTWSFDIKAWFHCLFPTDFAKNRMSDFSSYSKIEYSAFCLFL